MNPGNLIRKGNNKFELWRSLTNSRNEAKAISNQIVAKNGGSAVDSKVKKIIQEYAQDMFKDKSYWPWLATYTEVRGKFIEGWVPDDYYKFKLLPQWNPRGFSLISTLKTYDHRLFPDFSLKPLLIKVSNRYFNSGHKLLSFEEAVSLIKGYDGEIVIKEDSGPSGSGIIFIHTKDFENKYISVNKDLVIQPRLQQCNQFNNLTASSVNTFRVFTYLDTEGVVHIKKVFLRYGVGNSKIDNVMSGGGYIPVDATAFSTVSYDGLGFERGSKHPDTGFEFKNLTVGPFYEKMLKKCHDSHLAYPYVRFIGWDVAIDINDEPVLIEWNARSPRFWRYEARLGPFFKDQPISSLK